MMNNEKKLRICIDLDGTICEIRKDPQTYACLLYTSDAADE